MNEIFKIVVSRSLSGSLLILVLLLCKPLFKNRLSKRWQYYIWLVVIARLLLPFTPEASPVGRACELACDEAVICSLDPQGRRAYGNTLLNAIGAGGGYKDSLASVTLNESKEQLKERLDAIMKFKKTSRLTAAISVLLIFVLCFGATAAGAYTNPKQQSKEDITSPERQGNNPNQKIITVPVDMETVRNGAFLWLGEFTLSYGDKLYYDVSAEKGNGLKTGFAAPKDDPFNRTYFSISNKREGGTLETRGEFTFAAPAEPGQYNLFILATDGDLRNVKGSITIENTQSPTSTTPVLFVAENVKVDFNGIAFIGHGPLGTELVRSQNPNVTFELLNMDNEKSCTTEANIVDGIMQITVNNVAPNGLHVNFGPDYKNVVRIHIPDAVYTKFEIQSKEMVVQMQDFYAPVHVEADRAGFRLIDTAIARGTYDIQADAGPIYIEADTFRKEITAQADRGKVTVCFNQTPANLYLDTTNCSPVIERPDDWPAIYKIGSETPKITVISKRGKAVILAK